MADFFLRTLQRGVKTDLFSLAGYKGEQENNYKCKEHLGLILIHHLDLRFKDWYILLSNCKKITLISFRREKENKHQKDQVILALVWDILTDSTWDRQLKFSELTWFRISRNLSKFEFIQTTFIFKFLKNTKNQCIVLAGFFRNFSKGHPFEKNNKKVAWMNSNFERFQEILNQANSENFSCLSHMEYKNKNLPGCPKPGARWSGPY